MLLFAGRSNPGRREGANEDAIGLSGERQLFFVADGMGGHASGALASSIVRDTLLGTGEQPGVGVAGDDAADTALVPLILRAHANIVARTPPGDEQRMGSTIVAAQIGAHSCEISWVGDSRAYLLRGSELRQLTTDHSFLESLKAAQTFSETQIRRHPHRNLITQTLGMGDPVPSVVHVALQRGDRLLLCSDGLHGEIEDTEIARILGSGATPEATSQALIDAALDKGGRDNVSAVVVQYEGESQREPGAARASATLIAVLFGGIGALLAVAAWFWFTRHR
jgi:protein phosphatase